MVNNTISIHTWETIFDQLKTEGWSLGYGQVFEVPYGFLWMVDAKYYGTGKHFIVKATTLDRAFEGLESLIREMEPPREILH
jgi:hypothetical protein